MSVEPMLEIGAVRVHVEGALFKFACIRCLNNKRSKTYASRNEVRRHLALHESPELLRLAPERTLDWRSQPHVVTQRREEAKRERERALTYREALKRVDEREAKLWLGGISCPSCGGRAWLLVKVHLPTGSYQVLGLHEYARDRWGRTYWRSCLIPPALVADRLAGFDIPARVKRERQAWLERLSPRVVAAFETNKNLATRLVR